MLNSEELRTAFKERMYQDVQAEDKEVPNHLKDASRDTEGFGHGAGYLYPHAYRDHWVAQQYLPSELVGRVFYTPTDQGYEASIRDDVLSRRELQIAAILEESSENENEIANEIVNPIDKMWHASRIHHGDKKTDENLTFSPGDEKRNEWQRRLDSGRAEALLEIRNTAIDFADLKRHSRSLVIGADDGLFIWELWRREVEGFTCGLCKTERGKQILEQYASTLDMIDRPKLVLSLDELNSELDAADFDYIFFKDAVSAKSEFENFSLVLAELKNRFSNATFIFVQKIPSENQRLSNLVRQARCADTRETHSLLDEIEQAENEFFAQQQDFNWSEKDFLNVVRKIQNGDSCDKIQLTTKIITEKRKFNDADIERWFSPNSRYGAFLREKLGEGKSSNDSLPSLPNEDKINIFTSILKTESKNREWNWNSVYAFVKG